MSGQSHKLLNPCESGHSQLNTPNSGLAYLYSARFHPLWAKNSHLTKPKIWYRYLPTGQSQLFDAITHQPLSRPAHHTTSDIWHDLRNLLNDPRFPGQWTGYLSYDLLHHIESEKLPPKHLHPWPLIELCWGDTQTTPANQHPSPPFNLPTESPLPNHTPINDHCSQTILTSNFTPEQYQSAVSRVKQYIAAGDVFQVNLAQKLSAQYNNDPCSLFNKLMATSPAWYGAFLAFPSINNSPQRALLSTSPELFLKLENNTITTRPIKGTRPASTNPDELRLSEKDAAELHMIVDLMRNDLGRVCEYGSVIVAQGRSIESHPTVHHGVATIQGQLRPNMDSVDLLKATLPGGSITGAPKVRAMQIINELEPTPRGPYCGAIGRISNNSLHLNIAIRTIMLNKNTSGSWDLDFSVGGGIVADSNPIDEYHETLHKAKAMQDALLQ